MLNKIIVFVFLVNISLYAWPFGPTEKEMRNDLIKSAKQIQNAQRKTLINAKKHCKKALKVCFKKYNSIRIPMYTKDSNTKNGTVLLQRHLPFKIKAYTKNNISIKINSDKSIKILKFNDLPKQNCIKKFKNNCLNTISQN